MPTARRSLGASGLAPGREQVKRRLETGHQGLANYPLAQHVGRVPDASGDDKAPAAGKGTGEVAVQLSFQRTADDDPAALGPMGRDALQEGVDGLQWTGTDRHADAPERGERCALGKNRRQALIGLSYLPILNERGDVLSQFPGFLGFHRG